MLKLIHIFFFLVVALRAIQNKALSQGMPSTEEVKNHSPMVSHRPQVVGGDHNNLLTQAHSWSWM